MGIFDSFGRSWTIFWLKLTGRVDEANRLAMKDRYAIEAAYAADGKKLAKAYNDTVQAVSTLIHEQEKLKATRERKQEELARKQKIAEGAKAAAMRRAKALGSAEAAKADSEYQRHTAARRDALSSITEIEQYLGQLTSDIDNYGGQIEKAKQSLTKLERERSKLKGEAAEMVARMVSAESRTRVQDILSGIGSDRDDSYRADIREIVSRTEAEARVKEELSGTSATDAEDEYLATAASYEADAELDDELAAMFDKDEAVESGGKATDKPVTERPLDA